MTTEKTTAKAAGSKRTSATRKPRAATGSRTTRAARKRKPRENTIVCQETLHISEVRDWHARMREMFDTGDPVTVDGSQVERADTASLQLMAALCLSLRAKGVACNWKDPSPVLLDSMDRLGLSGLLGLQG